MTFAEKHQVVQLPQSNFRNISIISHPCTMNPSHLQPRATTELLSISVDLPFLGILYKCLAPFDWHVDLRFIHIVACAAACSFGTRNSNPSCDGPRFIYPFASGWSLSGFIFLLVMKRDAMNIPVQVFVWACFHLFWVDTWEWKLLGPLVSVWITF